MTSFVVGPDAAALYELLPDGIVVVSGSGSIWYASTRAEKLLGYERGELSGQPIEILIAAELRTAHEHDRAEFMRNPAARPMGSGLQLTALRKDGSLLPVEVSLAPTDSTAGKLVVAGIRDQTDTRAAARQLARSRQRLELLIVSVPETAVFSIDADGLIKDWNQGAADLTGYRAHHALEQNYRMLFPSSATAEPQSLIADAAATGTGTASRWMRRADGTRFAAKLDVRELSASEGSASREFAVCVRDVTEERLTAARLSIARELLDQPASENSTVRLAQLCTARASRELLPATTSFTPVPRDVPADARLEHQQAHPGAAPALLAPVTAGEHRFGELSVAFPPDALPGTHEQEFINGLAASLGDAVARYQATQDRQRLSILEDQERIARDLHDTVIQQIFAAGLRLQAASRRIDEPSVRAEVGSVLDDLDRCNSALRAAIYHLEGHSDEHEIRNKIFDLVSAAAPAMGLMPSVRFDGPADIVVPGTVAEDLLKTLNELLSNISKHANASRVSITLEADRESLALRVTDDGDGIGSSPTGSGHGLANLKSRAEAHDGEFIWAAPASGGTESLWRVRL